MLITFPWSKKLGVKQKTINRKHLILFLMALVGQSSQGRTPPAPGTNGTKWRFDCRIKHNKASLSQGRVPICPGHHPAQDVYVYCFSLVKKTATVSTAQHVNFISPQNAENGDPKIRNRDGPGNSGKFRVSVEFPQKPLVRVVPENSFWGPHFWRFGGFFGRNENGQS